MTEPCSRMSWFAPSWILRMNLSNIAFNGVRRFNVSSFGS